MSQLPPSILWLPIYLSFMVHGVAELRTISWLEGGRWLGTGIHLKEKNIAQKSIKYVTKNHCIVISFSWHRLRGI